MVPSKAPRMAFTPCIAGMLGMFMMACDRPTRCRSITVKLGWGTLRAVKRRQETQPLRANYTAAIKTKDDNMKE